MKVSYNSIKARINARYMKTKTNLHDWFVGTEAKPVPVFGKRARIYRWYLKKFRGYVDLHTSSWDSRDVCYYWDVTLVHKSKIPEDAVAIVGKKNAYHYDMDNMKRGFSTVEDNGFTAVSAWLYMKCNKFEDAMRVNLDAPGSIDMKKLITIAAVAFGVFCGLYFYAMQ